MSKYIINGGKKLSGTIKVSGNKNSIFPCLAAALLTEEEVVLKNIPSISDVDVSIQIFQALGVEISKKDSCLNICAKNLNSHILPKDLMRKLRGSIVFVGGLLGRLGVAEFVHPGGDVIGKRTIHPHIDGFKELGFEYEVVDLEYKVFGQKEKKEISIFLEEASPTATQNLILAAVLGEHQVVLKNCAREPQVVDLCRMLNQMGAKIEGGGETTITITGVAKLIGTEFSIGPDYLEAGTYGVAAALSGGEVLIEGFSLEGMEPILYPLKKMGLQFSQEKSGVRVKVEKLVAMPKLITNIWPGFPSDMMSLIVVLATQAQGVSLLHDWMYESRMFFVDKLIAMGANVTIADPHRVVVYGPTRLLGRELETPDIRAGMALVLAALVANGESTINRAELIERGFEDVVGKLSSLGANIKQVA